MREVSFDPGQEIERAGATLDSVLFPLAGVLSVFATTHGGRVEVGMIGREGMTGLPAVFGCERSSHTVVVQVAGAGLSLPAREFRSLVERVPALGVLALRFGQAHLTQISQCGLANARSTVTERLARWLLMCFDRAGEADISVTHETLSGALGVRRPGVTVATHMLEGEGAIRAKRGRISVLDRLKLERLANGSYGGAEQVYDHLFAGLEPARLTRQAG